MNEQEQTQDDISMVEEIRELMGLGIEGETHLEQIQERAEVVPKIRRPRQKRIKLGLQDLQRVKQETERLEKFDNTSDSWYKDSVEITANPSESLEKESIMNANTNTANTATPAAAAAPASSLTQADMLAIASIVATAMASIQSQTKAPLTKEQIEEARRAELATQRMHKEVEEELAKEEIAKKVVKLRMDAEKIYNEQAAAAVAAGMTAEQFAANGFRFQSPAPVQAAPAVKAVEGTVETAAEVAKAKAEDLPSGFVGWIQNNPKKAMGLAALTGGILVVGISTAMADDRTISNTDHLLLG